MRVLAGDIGGTKTDLRLYVGPARDALVVEREARFDSQSFAGLLPILGEFLRGERVDSAAFGVAGPVIDGVCKTTNLPWLVAVPDLQNVCGTPYCALLNDVQIAALGISRVPEDRKVWLQRAPLSQSAPMELVAVGTGFGRSYVIPGAGAFASELGHSTFPARNVIERRLVDFLSERFEAPTVEHVLSGPGVHLLYEFIVNEGLAPATAQFEIDAAEDRSAVVGRLGVRDLDPASSAAVGLFVDLLGSVLGNLALASIPRGGIYLWGGVALKLRSAIEQGHLLDAFLDKPPMGELLKTIPLALIAEPELGLLGGLAAAVNALPA